MEPSPTLLAEPLVQAQPKLRRRVGRPKGSKGRVIQGARVLGAHHFAFVRESLLGLDLAEAFHRYLARSETTTDVRHVQHRRDGLLKHIIEAGRQLDARLEPQAKITPLLELLSRDAAATPVLPLPALDEWIASEGIDRQYWREDDLLAEYKVAFGQDEAAAVADAHTQSDPAGERVQALNHLETLLSIIPAGTDRLDIWVARPVTRWLLGAGLLTLADLVRFINQHGYRWHDRIKGLGVERARQLLEWLESERENLNLFVSTDASEAKTKREARLAGQAPQAEVMPLSLAQFGAGTRVSQELALIKASPTLNGSSGSFRSRSVNTLAANDDPEAVNAWLARFNESPHTLRSYRKEVERFMLWCARELSKPLSDVNLPDCLQYREFLKAVPPTWIGPGPLKRTDPAWRAFRGQPSPASQKQALVILQSMYDGLVDAGYLVANPMRALMKRFGFPVNELDISRSFTEAEWQHVLRHLQSLPAGPESLRLKCILELLVTTGIRLEELAGARHRDLRLQALPDLPQTWILTVTGKHKKTREVPLNPDIVKLLAQHTAEFLDADKLCADPANLPLIRALHTSVLRWRVDQGGEPSLVAITQHPGSALAAAGISAVLKRFFAKAATTAAAAGLEPQRFERASTHWMRHTFVRQALEDGLAIEVVGELAGHVSLDTTSIYAKQELARKVSAPESLLRRTKGVSI